MRNSASYALAAVLVGTTAVAQAQTPAPPAKSSAPSAPAKGQPKTANVVVIIDGIEVGKGIVNVAFCDKGPLEECRQYGADQPATAETLGFRFENVPPGIYATVGFQDFDSSGDNERNMLGMPKEPFALGAAGEVKLIPPPNFDTLKKPIVEGENVLRMTLRTVTGTTKKKGVPTLAPEVVPAMIVQLPPKP